MNDDDDYGSLLPTRDMGDIPQVNDMLVRIHQQAVLREPVVPFPDEAWEEVRPDIARVIADWDTVLTPAERDYVVERIGVRFRMPANTSRVQHPPGFHAELMISLLTHWKARLIAVLGEKANPDAVEAMAGELSSRSVTHDEFDTAISDNAETIAHLAAGEKVPSELIDVIVSDIPWMHALRETPLYISPTA